MFIKLRDGYSNFQCVDSLRAGSAWFCDCGAEGFFLAKSAPPEKENGNPPKKNN